MRLITRRYMPLVAAAVVLMAPSTSAATSTAKQIKAAKANAVAYLKSTQQPNGSFAGFTSDWALGALAAAGTAAADVAQTGGTDARSYYRGLFGDPSWPGSEPSVTEFERAALNAYAAGIDPERVSIGQNLIARILSFYQPSSPGYYGSASNFSGALFGLISLADAKSRTAHQVVPQALLNQSIAVVRGNQHNDGGWAFAKAEGNPIALAQPSEPDETGAAMAALCTSGVSTSDPAIHGALGYLKANLVDSTGAFNAPFGPNTDSNAWAVQGLNACGIDPQEPGFTTTSGKTPIDFLLAQQVASGGFRFEPGEAAANEYSSQDGLRSISGGGFTATPPTPRSGAPRWLFSPAFAPGVQSRLGLVINDGTSALKVCSVLITPAKATTTLAAVLEAAKASSVPAGCVTDFEPASGGGAITRINGRPAPAEPRWSLSIDGGKEVLAKRSTAIRLGNVISLKLN
jgi:hypothetical protein